MSSKKIQKNYNGIFYLLIILIFISSVATVLLGVNAIMFYKANFYNKNYNTQNQIVNVNNKIKEFEKININNCSKNALKHLSSIGETKAKKIISMRPYVDIYEIKDIVGEKTFNNIKEYITVREE